MEGTTEIDVIILSYARNSKLKEITEKCVESLLSSEDPKQIKFNILILESHPGLAKFEYQCAKTVYLSDKFSYNKFFNMGVAMTSAKYICLCDNDLIFHPRWASEILKAFNKFYDLSSASPICSIHHPRLGFELNSGIHTGYRNKYEFAGWCNFLKRDAFRLIGKLDENYTFWCSDNDFANVLKTLKLRHVLVSSSVVDHLDGMTIDQISLENNFKFTSGEYFYYKKKWNHRMRISIIENLCN